MSPTSISISRWAIGVVVIATIAGTTQGLTAWLLGSSYAVGLGVIAVKELTKARREQVAAARAALEPAAPSA